MILTCSENKNVTTRMSSVGRAGGSPFGVDYGRGLAILQTPPPALHRPPTDRGVSDTEATPLKRVRLFMGRSDGGLALSPSDLQYSSELAYILECCSEKNRSRPRRLSRAPAPIEQLYRGTASTTSAANCSSTIPGSRSVRFGKGLVSILARFQPQ